MLSASFVPLLLLVLLLSTWMVFILFAIRTRGRLQGAVKKCEDARRQLRDEVGGVSLVMSLLNGIHESALESAGQESKAHLARMIVDSACQIMKCPNASLLLIDRDAGDLYVAAAKGIAELPATTRFKVGEGAAGQAAESGRIVVVGDIDTDARFIKREGLAYRLKSLVAVPLKVKNRVLGVLNICAENANHEFEERHLRLLNVLADQSAITLENLESYENLQMYYMEMVQTLARALELKENLHKDVGSYDRVRSHARMIALELNLPESIVRHVEFASLVNGIGKIGVDDAILRKPGKLTPEEYAQVKKHPEIGKKILAQVKFLSPVTPMVLYHQERWDGKGYPAGLKGEEIPLGSRIVAVVNAFQAMMSERPYRKSLTQDQALEELQTGAGTQFDPAVVQAFVQALRKSQRPAA